MPQPGKAQPTSKEQKARAAAAGGKGRKKKWSKQRTKEKVNNAVLFEKARLRFCLSSSITLSFTFSLPHLSALCSSNLLTAVGV